MITLADALSHIHIINLPERKDRWETCTRQLRFHNLKAKRYNAIPGGVYGCSRSHYAIYALASYHKWPYTLILEDDFKILHADFKPLLSACLADLPSTWTLLYLGGHSADPFTPITPTLRSVANMRTTSSYLITLAYANYLLAHYSFLAPADIALAELSTQHTHYVTTPRLIVQGSSMSDLTHSLVDYTSLMSDPICISTPTLPPPPPLTVSLPSSASVTPPTA